MSRTTSDGASETPAELPAGFLEALAAELDGPDVTGIALGGSFARGAATEYSDVDVAPFYREGTTLPPKCLFWRGGWLVSVSPKTVSGWRTQMAQPEWAIYLVPSASRLHILLDKDGTLSVLVAEASAFRWEPLQPEADAFAGQMLMLFAEHALKLLGALARNDDACLPYPLGELLYSLPQVVAVQRGLMIESDHTFYQQVQASAGGNESAWSRAHRAALGLHGEPLRERAAAALRLYAETARLTADTLQTAHRDVVAGIVERIVRESYAWAI
jgi:nucleotidyltransferase-like protein